MISRPLPHASHFPHGTTLSSCINLPTSSVHEAIVAAHKVLGRFGLSAEWVKQVSSLYCRQIVLFSL